MVQSDGKIVPIQISEDSLRRIDVWRQHASGLPSRVEAIHRLIEFGLTMTRSSDTAAPATETLIGGLRSVGPEDEVRAGPEAPKP